MRTRWLYLTVGAAALAAVLLGIQWGAGVPDRSAASADEIARNIKTLVEHTPFGPDIAELRTGAFRVTRVLHVKSDGAIPAYTVAELVDDESRPLAAFGLDPDGRPVFVTDLRGLTVPPSLDLTDAAERVRTRLGQSPASTEYVYFHNVAEAGFSMFRPLVAATTPRGVVYLNSRGEGFVEDGSALAAQFAAGPPLTPTGLLTRTLRPAGQW